MRVCSSDKSRQVRFSRRGIRCYTVQSQRKEGSSDRSAQAAMFGCFARWSTVQHLFIATSVHVRSTLVFIQRGFGPRLSQSTFSALFSCLVDASACIYTAKVAIPLSSACIYIARLQILLQDLGFDMATRGTF